MFPQKNWTKLRLSLLAFRDFGIISTNKLATIEGILIFFTFYYNVLIVFWHFSHIFFILLLFFSVSYFLPWILRLSKWRNFVKIFCSRTNCIFQNGFLFVVHFHVIFIYIQVSGVSIGNMALNSATRMYQSGIQPKGRHKKITHFFKGDQSLPKCWFVLRTVKVQCVCASPTVLTDRMIETWRSHRVTSLLSLLALILAICQIKYRYTEERRSTKKKRLRAVRPSPKILAGESWFERLTKRSMRNRLKMRTNLFFYFLLYFHYKITFAGRQPRQNRVWNMKYTRNLSL